MLFEVTVGGLPAGVRGRLSPLGTCAAAPAAMVCVAAWPAMPSAASDPSAAAGVAGEAGVAGAARGILGERADDRFGQPVRRRLEGSHLGEQAVGGGPLAGVLGQAALDQRPHSGRHPVQAGGVMDHAVQQRRRDPGAERALARGGEGEDRAQAEDVARRPDFVTGGLLGGHEPGRTQPQPRLRQLCGFHRLGDTEVDDPRAVLGQQHVRRLEVPVHHARPVDRAQALRQACGQC